MSTHQPGDPLPAWVYDVLVALIDWRDTHPRLFAEFLDQANGEFRMQEAVECGCKPLDHVPAEILARAETIRAYLASKEPA